MKVIEEIDQKTHEKVVYFHDPKSKLESIVAIHNTELGPSLGGCRMRNYSSKKVALSDVLRLSEGMTYKAALAGVKLGGGKAVIFGDPQIDKNDELLESFGTFIETFKGAYITAEDMGMTVDDMAVIKRTTKNVTGLSQEKGGSGNPADFTSYGTYLGIKAAVESVFSTDSLDGLSIAVQGIGSVGLKLIDYLAKYDTKIYISDIKIENIDECIAKYDVIPITNDELFELQYDIFCPCAVGSIINDKTIQTIKCKIIAGAANNVLQDYQKHGEILLKKNILYAPDYVINAGGLINIYNEFKSEYNRDNIFKQLEIIYENLMKIFNISKKNNIPTNKVSDELALQVIKNHKLINKL